MPKNVPIKYTSRDFASIKQDLVDYARRYYPTTYKDFNEASFGSMVMDMVAYVGDILSFYVDYQANESFLDSAAEFDNVLRLSRQLGYKSNYTPSSQGVASFFILVPANTIGSGPNVSYMPILKKGTQLATTSGISFLLNEDVHFNNPNNEVVVGRADPTTGNPTYYAVKAYGTVLSGEIFETVYSVGQHQRFLKIPLTARSVSEIVSVIDDEGHEYYEVDYLSQDVIYREVTNRGNNRDTVKNILKPFVVPRRFVVEKVNGRLVLQFGYGSEDQIKTDLIADPSAVVLKQHGRSYVTDDTFDPSNLVRTDKFGVVPSNTKLTIKYRMNSADSTNIPVSSLVEVVRSTFSFDSLASLTNSTVQFVRNSLEVTNEERIIGDITFAGSSEVKTRALDHFATQNRAVTKQDYKSYIYSMPPKFGAIKRCGITQDHDSFKRNLNVHIISEASDKTLVKTNMTIKKNLKTWLQNGKMVNDTIDIMDATIVNLGIEFVILPDSSKNKFEVLELAIAQLRSKMRMLPEIGEPFYITDVYRHLNDIDSVVDVTDVRVVLKSGDPYSDAYLNIDNNLSSDGRLIKLPENFIWEIKYPQIDIKGTIT